MAGNVTLIALAASVGPGKAKQYWTREITIRNLRNLILWKFFFGTIFMPFIIYHDLCRLMPPYTILPV